MADEQLQGEKKERASTYVVQDRKSEEEIQRLLVQDQMITAGMGGVLPEQEDATVFTSVLDVGCGTGGWLIEVAKKYENMKKLVGVDISGSITEYARLWAEREGMGERVAFRTMDTLRMLEFPEKSFDLVNLRFGSSWLRTWDWEKVLAEFQRVAKRKGVIRITEFDIVQSNSLALTPLMSALQEALYNAGHFYRPERDGLTKELGPLLVQHGAENVQTRAHVLTYRAGTEEGGYFLRDMQHMFRTVRPYIQKWGLVLENYDTLYQQAMEEIQQKGFVGTWRFVTAWGTKGK